VEKLWQTQYRNIEVKQDEDIGLTKETDEYDLMARDLDVVDERPAADELQDFWEGKPEPISGTPLEYWLNDARQKRYPRLSQMAIDILSIPAMSAEAERVFSGARRTISWERAQLGGDNIMKTECLKSWLRSHITKSKVVSVVDEVLKEQEDAILNDMMVEDAS
jgi:hypothetical protein